MVFGRLLPREGNFFELFNEHGKLIAEGGDTTPRKRRRRRRRPGAREGAAPATE